MSSTLLRVYAPIFIREVVPLKCQTMWMWRRNRDERKRDGELVPGAQMVTVEKGGHFLPLDAPQAVIDQIRRFQATAVD